MGMIVEDFQQQDVWKKIRTSWREREVIVGLKKEDEKEVGMWFGRARSDRFWDFGDCIGEFPEGRKESKFVVKAGFHIYCKVVCLRICTWDHERNGNGNLKILDFIKSPSFQQQKLKDWNYTVVDTFSGHGPEHGKNGGCFLRCSITQYIQGKPQTCAPLSRAHF